MHSMRGQWRGLATGLAVLSLFAVGYGRETPSLANAPANASPRMRMQLTTAPSPPPVGRPVHFVLTVTASNGRPLTGAQARLELTMATMDMGTIPVALREKSPGHYVGQGTIPMGGEWNCRAIVTRHRLHAQRLFHLHAG